MHPRSSRVAVTLSLGLACGAPLFLAPVHVAQGAESKKSEAAHVKAARARFQEGVRAYDRKEYEKARAAFLEAYRLHAHPTIFLNIAQSALRAGHALEASRYFSRYLHEASPATSADAAQQGLKEAEASLGRLQIRAAPGLEASIDGESVGTTPLADAVDVAPGAHRVRVGTLEQQVTAVAGQSTTVDATAPPPPAAVKIDATPPSAVAAPSKPSLFAPPARMVPVYVAGGVAVAGFATAIIAAVGRGKASDSATSATALIDSHGGNSTTCGSTAAATVAKFGQACGALATDNSQASTDGTVRDIGVVVGAVALVGGVVYYLVAPKAQSAEPAPVARGLDLNVTPLIGQTAQGLSLTGTF